MEKKQKLVLMIWMGLITLCIVFPPFTLTKTTAITTSSYSPIELTTTTIVRYGFLFSSPPEPRPVITTRGLYGGKTIETEEYEGFSVWRLILEILAVSFGCLFALLYVKYISKPQLQPSKDANAS